LPLPLLLPLLLPLPYFPRFGLSHNTEFETLK
jgi:hypothetical protein